MIEFTLNGPWEFRAEQESDWLEGQVPGCVHGDLLRLGRIPNPNFRQNEAELQWIGRKNWTYSRTFNVPNALLSEANIVLRAEGLDTLATLRLNGVEVARADNMHRTWEWDVKARLCAGENTIEILFASPQPFLEEKGAIHPLEAWNEYNGIRHRGWLRKQHSNFGWDWAPVLVSCGIWRSIALRGWSGPRLRDVAIEQRHGTSEVAIKTVVELSQAEEGTSLEVEVRHQGRIVAKSASVVQGDTGASELTISEPQLWWPAGLGAQPLYTVAVHLLSADKTELDSWSRRIGLRTLRLVRQPDQEEGESFHFEANGILFFAKGANWANPLPYPEWPAEQSWKQLLSDAVLAHHNMIRIWGGAYFCPDEFYDFCDEIGLTVWQDFLYACGPYPSFNEDFLANIDAEAKDNVRRLRHHPSMALWCGNNELEGAFTAKEWTNMKMSFEDYDKIFNGILKRAVETLDPHGNYWPASPVCTGADRATVDPNAGDAHIWEIWFSDAPFENFRNYKNRFISEFGFQSLPTRKTVDSFTLPEDRQFNSPVLEFHQRSAPGNLQQLKAMIGWFRLSTSFADQIALSQLVQANCVKIGVEHWRRSMPRTMGALYWQLNDCWPCPSWSSIDFQGRWKALHYFSARFFAPVLISGLEDLDKETVEVHVSNDRSFEISGVVSWNVFDLEGGLLLQHRVDASVPAVSSCCLATIDLKLIVPKPAREAILVHLHFAGGDGNESSNLVLLDRPKKMELRDPKPEFSLTPATGNSWDVELTVRRPAPWVWLDFDRLDPRLSENFFALWPDQPRRITLSFPEPVTEEHIRDEMRIRHLRATY